MYKFNMPIIFTALFLSFMSSFCWAATTSIDSMSAVKTTQTDVSNQAYSTIKITYPVIKNDISYSKELNQAIKQTIDGVVQEFKKNLSKNLPLKPIPNLPLTANSNNLDINYKMFSTNRNVISIRFSIYTNFYGAAHPFTTFLSLNYDIKQKKLLSLDQIFKSKDYLQFLATYSKKVLTKKLSKAASTSTEPDQEGLKPLAKNFKIWNLTSDGLLLTFPPYQVAAYVFGPQEVLIPYAAVKNMLREA